MANNTGLKFGGRSKGTPNKFTKELRDKVNTFIDSNYKQFEEDFKALDTKDRVNFYMKLLDMSLPKLFEDDNSKDSTPIINVKWITPDAVKNSK